MEAKEILEEIDDDFYTAEEYDIEEILGIDSSGLSTKDREILEESKKIIIQLKNLIKNSKYATAAATGVGALGLGYGAYKLTNEQQKLKFWIKIYNMLPPKKKILMFYHGLPYFSTTLRYKLADQLSDKELVHFLKKFMTPVYTALQLRNIHKKIDITNGNTRPMTKIERDQIYKDIFEKKDQEKYFNYYMSAEQHPDTSQFTKEQRDILYNLRHEKPAEQIAAVMEMKLDIKTKEDLSNEVGMTWSEMIHKTFNVTRDSYKRMTENLFGMFTSGTNQPGDEEFLYAPDS